MTGTIFFGKKPGLPERVRTNTQAVLRLAWGGWRKEINRCNKPRQASFLKNFLVSTWRKEISRCNKPRLRGSQGLGAQGLGPGPPGAWGLGRQSLTQATLQPFATSSEKSAGGRQAKG